jgi:AcrR family transcriptional regulator
MMPGIALWNLIVTASAVLTLPQTDRYTSHDEQVRQRLMDAAIACVQAVGLAKVSMRDVAERAGLVRQTVYNYYPNKNRLLSDAFNREGAAFAQAIAAHIQDVEGADNCFIAGFLYVVEHFPRNPILALVLEQGSDFLRQVGMSYYPFGAFGEIAFARVFAAQPAMAAEAEEISEYWTRSALSFLTIRGATERNRDELAAYVRRRLLPGLPL